MRILELLLDGLRAIPGAAWPILAYLTRQLYLSLRARNIKHFWQPFIRKHLTLVITEYPVTGDTLLEQIAQIAGGRYLMSKGMALALAHLLDFNKDYVTKRENISICGSQSGSPSLENVVILGSPANNPFSALMFQRLGEVYNIPYSFSIDEGGKTIEIITSAGDRFSPSLAETNGDDYAIIIKAVLENAPTKSVIIIAGCRMWGTQAAATAVTDTHILNTVAEVTDKAMNVAFLIRTGIVNNEPTGPELEINNRIYIEQLEPRELESI